MVNPPLKGVYTPFIWSKAPSRWREDPYPPNWHILTMTNMWISSDWPWTMYVDFSGVFQVISPNKAGILLILSVDLGILNLSLIMNWCDSSHTYEFGKISHNGDFTIYNGDFIQRGVTVLNIFITISKMGRHSLTFVTKCGSTDSWLRPSIRKRTVLRCRNIVCRPRNWKVAVWKYHPKWWFDQQWGFNKNGGTDYLTWFNLV